MIGKVNPGPPVFTKATYTFECWSCSLPTFHVLSISFSPSSCLYLTSHLILISRLIPPQATPSLLRPVSSEDHVVYVCFPSGIAVSPLPTPCLPPAYPLDLSCEQQRLAWWEIYDGEQQWWVAELSGSFLWLGFWEKVRERGCRGLEFTRQRCLTWVRFQSCFRLRGYCSWGQGWGNVCVCMCVVTGNVVWKTQQHDVVQQLPASWHVLYVYVYSYTSRSWTTSHGWVIVSWVK